MELSRLQGDHRHQITKSQIHLVFFSYFADDLNILQHQYSDAVKINQEQKSLVSQLEGDLLSVHPYIQVHIET
jgi:hypothetical protein